MAIKITVQGENLSFSCETTVVKAAQVIAFLGSESTDEIMDKNPVLVEPSSLLSTNRAAHNKSPRESIIESGAKTNPQKIATLANYLLQLFNNESFTTAEIRQLFDRAGEPTPKNFSRDLKEAVRLGFIYESAEETGKYLLSDKGRDSVNAGFFEAEISSKRKRLKKSKTTQKFIREEIKQLIVEPNVEGWISFRNLTTKSKKIIWLLAYSDKNNINELSSSEVSYLADKLRETISTKDFHALTKESIKKGYITLVNGGKYKIRQAGLNQLSKPPKGE